VRTRRLRTRCVAFAAFERSFTPVDLLRGVPPFVLAPRTWRPAADVCETPDAITVTVDLAGADEQDIDIQLFENALVIEGERRPTAPPGEAVYHTAEIRQGPYRLEVLLPRPVDGDGVTADYDLGLLTVRLPLARSRRVAIEPGRAAEAPSEGST
jgi:HSP20 family protein